MITATIWTAIHQSIKRQRQEERRQQQQQPKTVSVKGVLAPDIFSTVWKVAAKALNTDEPPTEFPYCTAPGTNTYVYEPASHWTSGFFAGTLWALYERLIKDREGVESPITKEQLLEAARKWQEAVDTKHLFAVIVHTEQGTSLSPMAVFVMVTRDRYPLHYNFFLCRARSVA